MGPGFIPGRSIDDDVMAVSELLHFCEAENMPGLFVMLDNEKAYDRVQHSFLLDAMEAFGLPTWSGQRGGGPWPT